jgi:hypothetical protein
LDSRTILRRLVIALGVAAGVVLSATLTCLPGSDDPSPGDEYAIASDAGGFAAKCRSQHFHARWDAAGLGIEGTEAGAPWAWSYRLTGVGREGGASVTDAAPTLGECAAAGAKAGARASCVRYERAGVVEWYANLPRGIEQGFEIAERPDGAGPLVIVGEVSGDLTASLPPDGESVVYSREGQGVLTVTALATTDAKGKRLPGRFDLEGGLRLVIDDARAVYPVRVDPMILDFAQSWVRTYNGPDDSTDEALDLGVTAAGSVVVTGGSTGNTGDLDYVTIQYDTTGATQWLARYAGPADFDEAVALAVGDADEVTVTGSSRNIVGNLDAVTIRYDAAGGAQWLARYDGTGGGRDTAADVALDGSGNALVAGSTDTVAGGGTDLDTLLLQVDGTGAVAWARTYAGPVAGGTDEARAVAVSPAGNAYVAGVSDGAGTGTDVAVAAWDASGNPLWNARYDGAASNDDEGNAIALAPGGDVLVAGASDGDMLLVRYDAAGNFLWDYLYDGPAGGEDGPIGVKEVSGCGCGG